MSINIIVACCNNGEIGYKNDLIVKLKKDLKRFKDLTIHHDVLMGRKTFESIGRKLPDRYNVVVTSDKTFHEKHEVGTITDIHEYIYWHKRHNPDYDLWIIGGQTIYDQTLDMVDEVYLTHINYNPCHADSYFPFYKLENKSKWELIDYEPEEENGIVFVYKTYRKISGGS